MQIVLVVTICNLLLSTPTTFYTSEGFRGCSTTLTLKNSAKECLESLDKQLLPKPSDLRKKSFELQHGKPYCAVYELVRHPDGLVDTVLTRLK